MDEICTVCGTPFDYPPVPREYALNHVYVNKEMLPACGHCAAVYRDTSFRLVFDFKVGTEASYTGDQSRR